MKIKEGGGVDIEKEREAFENHLKKMGKTDNETFSKNEDDSYQMDIIHFGWKIWQAATSRMEVRINTLDEMLLNQGEALAQAKAQAVPEWIRMEDKYPKAGESVLICINGIRQNIAYFYDCSVSNEYSDHDWFEPVFTGGEAGDECVVKTEDVTHWMLLPQEPAND